jgi:hypothetical protein
MNLEEMLAKAARTFDENAEKHLAALADGLRGEGFSEDEIERSDAIARGCNAKAREEFMAITRSCILSVEATWEWPEYRGVSRLQ